MVETRDAAFSNLVFRHYSKHNFDDLREFDYLEKYVKFVPELATLGLDNSFREQLEAKEDIEKIIR